MPTLFYKGVNIVKTVSYAELTAHRNGHNIINTPYSSPRGSDANSLKVDIIAGTGFSRFDEEEDPITIRYNFERREAVIEVDWDKIELSHDEATVSARISGNYRFSKDIDIKIIKVKKYASITQVDGIVARDKIKIATLNLFPLNDAQGGFYQARHHVKIFKAQGVCVKECGDDFNESAQSYDFTLPIGSSHEIALYYDFGEKDATADKQIQIECLINGTLCGKSITIPSYSPVLSADIRYLLENNTWKLSPKRTKIAEIDLFSDVRIGGKSLEYSLSTNSDFLVVKDGEGVLTPDSPNTSIGLYVVGEKLQFLPDDDLMVEVKNRDNILGTITFTKRPPSQNNQKGVVYLTASKIAESVGTQNKKTLYVGGEDNTILFKVKAKRDASPVKWEIKDSKIAKIVSEDLETTFSKDQTYFAHVMINCDDPVSESSFSVRVSAPYCKDEIIPAKFVVKPLKEVEPSFAFEPLSNTIGSSSTNTPITIYRGGDNVIVGTLKVSCKPKEEDTNVDETKYQKLDLSSLSVVQEGTECLILEQREESVENLQVKKHAIYNVKTNRIPCNINELHFSFKCCGKNSKLQTLHIKDQLPQNRPTVQFAKCEPLFYPIEDVVIKVGTIDVEPVALNEKKQYARTNGTLLFDSNSHFYFSKENDENTAVSIKRESLEMGKDKNSLYSQEITIDDACKSSISIYFDVCKYNNNVQNLTEETITVELPLKYKDDNVDIEPVSIEAVPNTFIINQYEALPELAITLVDSKGFEYQVVFDEFNNAEVRVSNEIRYSLAMLSLPPGKKFSLILKNQQRICIPDNVITITEIESDKEFISVDFKKPCCIHNGGKEVTIDIKVDWSKIVGGCSCFNISGKLDGKPFTIKVCCPVYEIVTTNWRSLDLGTSAIVLSEMRRDNINTVIDTINLSDGDKSRSLEPHKDMISSVIALYRSDDNDFHNLLLSPERRKYNLATAILPAVKFLVGQTKMPFLRFFNKQGISKLKGDFLEETNLDENLVPQSILESIYKDIFSRMDKNAQEETKKLILTYPSTYTVEQRRNLKDLIIKEFKNLQEQNLAFVAESDAVLAQYLYSKRISVGGAPLHNGEQILIYDMGAGTLDISYVRIKIENEGEKNQITKAIVEKRIGIPVAGNYLDFCIFSYLKEYIAEEALGKPKALKKNIQELKKSISENTSEDDVISGDVSNINLKTDKKATISYQEIIESAPLRDFLKKCSEGVFELLLGENWREEEVTFVYSGRGSLFKPLINHIKKLSGWIPEPVADSPEEMKLCAAKGAIRYVQMFSKDSQQPYVIESFKYYASFGLVYRSYEKDGNKETYKCELLKSSDDFKTATEESLHSFVPQIDIRPEGPLILVQSYLPPDRISSSFNNRHLKKKDDDGCYITEIFRVFREDLGLEDSNLQEASVDFFINDYDDTIKCVIMNQPLNEYKFSESIENDDNYKNSMWPFND